MILWKVILYIIIFTVMFYFIEQKFCLHKKYHYYLNGEIIRVFKLLISFILLLVIFTYSNLWFEELSLGERANMIFKGFSFSFMGYCIYVFDLPHICEETFKDNEKEDENI